jgi:hypothetical protein
MADFLASTAFALIIVAQALAVLFARPYRTRDDAARAAIDGHAIDDRAIDPTRRSPPQSTSARRRPHGLAHAVVDLCLRRAAARIDTAGRRQRGGPMLFFQPAGEPDGLAPAFPARSILSIKDCSAHSD